MPNRCLFWGSQRRAASQVAMDVEKWQDGMIPERYGNSDDGPNLNWLYLKQTGNADQQSAIEEEVEFSHITYEEGLILFGRTDAREIEGWLAISSLTSDGNQASIVSQEEWLTARKELLEKEKAATRAAAAFKSQMQDFPMVKLGKKYTFEGLNGKATLSELFDGRKQLVVYHFMLGPDDEVGCGGCSFLADNLPSSLAHLHFRDTTLVVISRAPVEKIEKFKKRMGWKFPWYSSFASDFNYDFHVTLDETIAPVEYNYKPSSPESKGECPGMSVFLKDSNEVFHTYSSYARGLDDLLVTYRLLDLTPLGRQDTKMNGWKLHDDYTDEETKCLGHSI